MTMEPLKSAATFWTGNRILLAAYTIALFALMIVPMDVPERSVLGVGSDKWVHAALFGGLVVILQWNFAATPHPALLSVAGACLVAAGIEAVQALVVYRSGDFADFVAGAFGAVLGTVGMHRVVSSDFPERVIGLIVALVGLIVGAVFVSADAIGLSRNGVFGWKQIIGTALAAIIVMLGIGLYVCSKLGFTTNWRRGS